MSVRSELSKFWRIMTDPAYRAFRAEYKAFRAAHGKNTPASYTGLMPGDVVLDIGGYHGDWAEAMAARYAVNVHVFEPHPRFATMIEQRFAERDDVVPHAYAIGSADAELLLSDDENASSALVADGPTAKGAVRNVAEVFKEFGFEKIGATKMNIEGGEYDLLPALIENGLIDQFERITVQFHKFSEGDRKRRDDIREALSKTHTCVWCYPFIWEEWHHKALRGSPE
ncbi:methyltransferase, FkbM family [Shimia gijangensis]|uniref:Methyltransferase, FkbM family n=1 Tax=Shimia gijangensis TaxID=1470563 RepID=A0A1M6B588_9RHOB|nr:FkbM family methyltransferase [Shimia gijangensis]SHI43830.1 methyltransferase, FkbM family [Shimia gijangensis]